MAKKVYAVRKGRTTGILMNWDDCKRSVIGYPGAEYKSFGDMNEAVEYLQRGADQAAPVSGADSDAAGTRAYVDGSYDAANRKYSGAAVILTDGEKVAELARCCDDEQAELRNVAGEITGARLAIDYCIENGIRAVTILHDYEGVGKWGNAEWKANLPMTQAYRDYVAEARKKIEIRFEKVAAHTGIEYNERADFLAKKAIENSIE